MLQCATLLLSLHPVKCWNVLMQSMTNPRNLDWIMACRAWGSECASAIELTCSRDVRAAARPPADFVFSMLAAALPSARHSIMAKSRRSIRTCSGTHHSECTQAHVDPDALPNGSRIPQNGLGARFSSRNSSIKTATPASLQACTQCTRRAGQVNRAATEACTQRCLTGHDGAEPRTEGELGQSAPRGGRSPAIAIMSSMRAARSAFAACSSR